MVKVSVVMITYNHELYIKEAILAVLAQKTNFEIELIVANDYSPDKTEFVVREIIDTHPKSNIIKYTRHTANKGMMPNFIWAMEQCNGEYIALCEGDDYWTDPHKLQKQVDFLEINRDFILCFHPVKILKPNGQLTDDFITYVPDNFEHFENLANHGNYIHTPSVVFRNILKSFPDEFLYSPIGDYFIYMLLAQYGKIGRLDDTMSIYRYMSGIYSKLDEEEKKYKWLLTLLLLYSSYEKNKEIQGLILNQIKSVMIPSLPHINQEQLAYIKSNKYTHDLVDKLILQQIKILHKNQISNHTYEMLVIEIMNRGKRKITSLMHKLLFNG